MNTIQVIAQALGLAVEHLSAYFQAAAPYEWADVGASGFVVILLIVTWTAIFKKIDFKNLKLSPEACLAMVTIFLVTLGPAVIITILETVEAIKANGAPEAWAIEKMFSMLP